MDIWDHEGNALAIYQEADADPAEPPGPYGLARRLGVTIRHSRGRMMGGAKYDPSDESIALPHGLPVLVEVVRIYHELAERHLRSAVGDESHERACDELAFHLRMPRAAFRGLLGAVGQDLAALAAPWPASQTGAALRLLEVIDAPGVVVTPREIRPRGPEWSWPHESDLRRLARAKALPAGIERIPITDRRGSVLLLAS